VVVTSIIGGDRNSSSKQYYISLAIKAKIIDTFAHYNNFPRGNFLPDERDSRPLASEGQNRLKFHSNSTNNKIVCHNSTIQ
jgi:hypothetical protein